MERLNKFLAHAGVGSRRHCDTLIAAGRVKLNGKVVADLGAKVDPVLQKVAVDDQPVRAEKAVYWVVHKPPGYLCTNHDPAGRPLAADLIPHVEQRVYTVGRLDEASEGMLLMTNDGELANALMHPRYEVEKTYLVLVAGKPSTDDLQKLLNGVWLSDGKVKAKSVRRVKTQGDGTWLRVVLCEGKNREIRRMLAKLDHKVLRLKRIAIGTVHLDKLPKGKARKVTAVELGELNKVLADNAKRIARRIENGYAEPTGEAKATPPKPAAAKPATPRPFAKPAAKPFGRPPGKAPAKPTGKPFAKSIGKPVGASPGKPAGKPLGKPAARRPSPGGSGFAGGAAAARPGRPAAGRPPRPR
jgi:23S rRNA pseudouridine2605 synthase